MDTQIYIAIANMMIRFSDRLRDGGKLMEEEALSYGAMCRFWRSYCLNAESVFDHNLRQFLEEHGKDDDDDTSGTPIPIP